MSILDDAIREHLELKRAHGADATELKRLEDEAFGPPGRPEDPNSFSEAQTEFLAAPATDAADAAADAKAAPGERRTPNITDLQEAPEAPRDEPQNEEPDAEAPAAAEEPSSAEHQTVPVPRPEAGPDAKVEDAPAVTSKGPNTEERHAIADQPTEFFDVDADIAPAAERPSPTDEQLLDSKLSEPRLAPSEPTSPVESTGPDAEISGDPLTEDEDDFFSEQRLSDELNQALEAPVTDEHEALPQHEPLAEPPSDEHSSVPATDEHEAPPYTDEHEVERPSEEHTEVYDFQRERSRGRADQAEEHEDAEHDEHGPAESRSTDSEDVLEDTPDFLENAPEDDELWFEQKPPKDFDFDD